MLLGRSLKKMVNVIFTNEYRNFSNVCVLVPLFLAIVVDCMELSPFENGNIILSNTTYLSMAMYECNKDFLLLGEASRVCTDSGMWSGEEPTCQGMLNYARTLH